MTSKLQHSDILDFIFKKKILFETINELRGEDDNRSDLKMSCFSLYPQTNVHSCSTISCLKNIHGTTKYEPLACYEFVFLFFCFCFVHATLCFIYLPLKQKLDNVENGICHFDHLFMLIIYIYSAMVFNKSLQDLRLKK